MSRKEWIRHGLVFVASVFVVWLSGVVPVLVMKPGPYAGMTDAQVLDQMGAPTIGGLLGSWPILIALAICQALSFHYIKKFTTPIYLGGVFIAGVLFAMRYWQLAGIA